MDDTRPKHILQQEYKVLRILQRLPYSTVYLGTGLHAPQDRWAIKEISLESFDTESRASILENFEIIARKYLKINHPVLVSLVDFFQEGDYEYIIFPFIPGHRLGEIFDLRTKPFDEFQTLDMGRQIAEALSYLHSQYIIFRDLNPSNIIITPEGSLKMTDFGLGKVISRQEPNQPKWGTAGYAPPEQFGDNVVFYGGLDIFALGVIMHQMLTFWDPLISKGIIPPVRKLNKDVSPEVEAIISRATCSDPEGRYPTVESLSEDIEKVLKIKSAPEKGVHGENWLLKLARELAKPFKKSKE